MNRQQAKDLLPIIQAFAEGKTIQYCCSDKNGIPQWTDVQFNEKVDFSDSPQKYRIKPELKYRPFKDTEECWQEMLKHQPFGWIKDKGDGYKVLITKVNDDKNTDYMSINGNGGWTLDGIMDYYTFADGTPFGIKEE